MPGRGAFAITTSVQSLPDQRAPLLEDFIDSWGNNIRRHSRDGTPDMTRWPIQARFWLEWGCSQVTDLVQRTD